MTNSINSRSKNKYNIASFFAGVGGIELGFEQTGKFQVVYANEFDKNAQKTYKANFPDVHLDQRDIQDIKEEDLPSNIDIITGGFPCQAFSIAGYRKGFEDQRGNLFFELLRMISYKKPKVVFIENVKNMVGHDHGNTFKIIREALVANGYHIKWKVLNTKDYGNLPQNRERIYIVGFTSRDSYRAFEFPEPISLTKSTKDLIDYESLEDENFYYKKGKQPFYDKLEEAMTDPDGIYQWRRQYVRKNKSGVVPTLTANMGTGGHNVPLILTKNGIRKLTPRETFNIQGFPKDFKLDSQVSNSQLYKQAGNSVSVPVIRRIAENIYKALDLEDTVQADLDSLHNYGIIYTDIWGKFMGRSELVASIDRLDDVKSLKLENNNMINFIDDRAYTRIIKKNMNAGFYSIVDMELLDHKDRIKSNG